MEAKVINVITQKGGCGKTTISMNLAGTIAIRHSKKVLIIDGDNQAITTKWAAKAPKDQPFPCHVVNLAKAEGSAHKEIEKFSKQYDLILVDCPPNTEAEFNASALLISDIAIIPFKPRFLCGTQSV